jgi:outer membrane protein assembly factor BamB
LEYGGDDGVIYIIDNQLLVRKDKEILKFEGDQLQTYYRSDSPTVVPLSLNLIKDYEKKEDGSTILNMFDIKASKISWSIVQDVYSLFTSFHSDDGIFFIDARKLRLFRIDDTTGQVIWEVEFADKQKIENCKLVVRDNCVVVHNKGGYLRGLDFETGEMRWELDNCHGYHTPHPETGHLHGIATTNKRNYEVIDPLRGERIVDLPMWDELQENGIISVINHMHCITSDEIYFTAHGRGSGERKFGRIDINNQQLNYTQVLEGENYNVSRPMYHEGRLYFINDNTTLWIYEES